MLLCKPGVRVLVILSLCNFESQTRTGRGHPQVCPGEKGTAREDRIENVHSGAPALLLGPAAEVMWRHALEHISLLLSSPTSLVLGSE